VIVVRELLRFEAEKPREQARTVMVLLVELTGAANTSNISDKIQESQAKTGCA